MFGKVLNERQKREETLINTHTFKSQTSNKTWKDNFQKQHNQEYMTFQAKVNFLKICYREDAKNLLLQRGCQKFTEV